jgi:hydroxymethylpyrimidine/phosphomethylpyrimidine kinase
MKGRVLICAGSDSGGGAGIQADIKTVTALGGYAMTAITALTAQNTLGVQGVVGVAPDFIRQQMRSALEDLGADSIKTGMLHDAVTINAVCDEIAALAPDLPLVADPVMVATSGSRLLADDAMDTLRQRLLPMAVVITPNIPEAEALTGLTITDEAGMREAAQALLGMGARAVLLKGGHMEGEILVDLLVTPQMLHRYEDRRIVTRHTHGTGCTLASAVATGLAQGLELEPAVRRARAYVRAAILRAPGLGAGSGPLDHTITVDTSRFD